MNPGDAFGRQRHTRDHRPTDDLRPGWAEVFTGRRIYRFTSARAPRLPMEWPAVPPVEVPPGDSAGFWLWEVVQAETVMRARPARMRRTVFIMSPQSAAAAVLAVWQSFPRRRQCYAAGLSELRSNAQMCSRCGALSIM